MNVCVSEVDVTSTDLRLCSNACGSFCDVLEWLGQLVVVSGDVFVSCFRVDLSFVNGHQNL